MYIVKNTTLNEITIKNSKFIALVYPVDNIIVINDILTKTKQKYKDATHIVYYFVLIYSLICHICIVFYLIHKKTPLYTIMYK